jgi:leucyl aminopeptidase
VTTCTVSTDPVNEATGLLILPVFEGPEPGPGVKQVGLGSAFADAKLMGKTGQSVLVTRRDGDRFAAEAVLLVGLGPRDELDANGLRRALGRAGSTARRFGVVATNLPQTLGARRRDDAVQAAVEGLLLGSYRFDRYRTKPRKEDGDLRELVVHVPERWDRKAAQAAAERGRVIAESVWWARDLVNTPAGDLPPAEIARAAQEMAREVGLTCKVWTEAQLERGGFGGIIGVGKGSVNPPRMVELRYERDGRRRPIALTGKGIAFDSGGLSIKDAKGMESMKDDMGGAASILGAMRAIALLRPRVNVIAAIPCAENLPSGSAQKPGDVITHRGGTTSEVLNTDAEGRLVLADALAYLVEQRPQLILDAATLTGACMVALGDRITGAFGNDRGLVAEVRAAGDAAGETIWELPLFPDYRKLIDSSVADIKNVGERWGGAITAAWFLAEFVGDVPWVHLDIAGPAFTDRAHDLGPRGATGVPVRSLVRFVLDRAPSTPTARGDRSRSARRGSRAGGRGTARRTGRARVA